MGGSHGKPTDGRINEQESAERSSQETTAPLPPIPTLSFVIVDMTGIKVKDSQRRVQEEGEPVSVASRAYMGSHPVMAQALC